MANITVFKTKAGKLTKYAFTCGYIEQYEKDNDNRLALQYAQGTAPYHVKGFINNSHIWEVFERVADARKFISSYKLQRIGK